jgi:hypothetical protein
MSVFVTLESHLKILQHFCKAEQLTSSMQAFSGNDSFTPQAEAALTIYTSLRYGIKRVIFLET